MWSVVRDVGDGDYVVVGVAYVVDLVVVVGEQEFKRHVAHCVDESRTQFVGGVRGRVVHRVGIRVLVVGDGVNVDGVCRCHTTILRDLAMQPNSQCERILMRDNILPSYLVVTRTADTDDAYQVGCGHCIVSIHTRRVRSSHRSVR